MIWKSVEWWWWWKKTYSLNDVIYMITQTYVSVQWSMFGFGLDVDAFFFQTQGHGFWYRMPCCAEKLLLVTVYTLFIIVVSCWCHDSIIKKKRKQEKSTTATSCQSKIKMILWVFTGHLFSYFSTKYCQKVNNMTDIL